MGFFSNLIKKLMKVARPVFSMEENELRFKISSDYFFVYPLEDFDIKTRHDPYVLDGFTIKTEDIFLENIQIDTDSKWNAEASSVYENFLKENLSYKDFKTVESKEYEHFTFKIFEIDEKYTLHFIHIWEVYKDVFIIDNKADLYKQLQKKLDNSYEYKKTVLPLMQLDFNKSLVKINAIHSYINYDEN